MRKAIFIVVVLVTGTCLWLAVRHSSHRLVVLTRFYNTQGLRPGAQVRVDGVDVGSVKNIRVKE